MRDVSVTGGFRLLPARVLVMAMVAACGAPQGSPPAGDSPPQGRVPAGTEGWANLDKVPYVVGATIPGGQRGAPGSRDALADAWRPVLVMPGGAFVMREPNWAAADALWRAGQAVVPRGEPVTVAAPHARGADPTIIFHPPTDHRILISPALPAIAAVTVVYSGGGISMCSGSYVGPRTFLLAGHCLISDEGEIAQHIIFEPGLDGPDRPATRLDCDNRSTDASRHFFAAIPLGWVRDRNGEVDTAVIDTAPCHTAAHWFGEPVRNAGIVVNADEHAGLFGVIGYPGIPCPGTTFAGFFQCGARGTAYINGPWLETDNIDADKGESGGPWFIGNRVAATHIGSRTYHDFFRCGFDACKRNHGRRIDDAFKAFIDLASTDYP